MLKLILRIRPVEVTDDLNLDLVQERACELVGVRAQVQDTRLYDAPYVSVIVNVQNADAKVLAQLRGAFGTLPRMRAMLWEMPGVEIPLVSAQLEDLERAASESDE